MHILTDGFIILHQHSVPAMGVGRLVDGQQFLSFLVDGAKTINDVRYVFGLETGSAQGFVAHGHLHHENGALSCRIVLHTDGALVQLHEGSQVESDACTDVAVLMLCGVEAVENFVPVLAFDAHA